MTMIVCYNRCLYCGRRTPHEVCHLHSRTSLGHNRIGSVTAAVAARLDAIPEEEARQGAWGEHFTQAMNRAWRRHFPRDPEVCEDEACPQRLVDWA